MKYLFLVIFLIACGGSSDSSDSSNNESACSAYKILGGESCNSEEIPTVLIELETDDLSGICTGTLVGNDYILTAGHCTTDLTSAHVYSDRGSQAVTSWITHPGFKGVNSQFDLALLKVPGFTKGTGTTPEQIGYDENVQINDQLSVIGYGVDENDNAGASLPGSNPKAAKIKVEIIEDGVIGNRYDSTKTNACFGDSGASLYKSGKIVGIESFGTTENCKDGDVNIFADVRSAGNRAFLDKYIK